MSLSVNTNSGALIALQNLTSTESQLSATQNEVSTGLAISGPADNGAVWAIAQGQRSQVSALDAVKQSLQRVQSTVDVATSAGTTVSDLLNQLKTAALSASDTSINTSSRSALATQFSSILGQIAKVVSNASFDGANLINGSTTSLDALASANGTSKLTVASENLSLGGSIITLSSTATFSTAASAATVLNEVTASISNTNNALAKLGTSSNALGDQVISSTRTSPPKAPSCRLCKPSSPWAFKRCRSRIRLRLRCCRSSASPRQEAGARARLP
jgi:flagellin